MNAYIFLWMSAAVIAASIASVLSGANDHDPQVVEILAEMGNLIRRHYNISRYPAKSPKSRLAATPEAFMQANLMDDIRLTPGQAKNILSEMKQHWGYEQRKPKIYPNNWDNYWPLPVKYTFDGSIHTEAERAIIRQAIQLWDSNTCVNFKEYPTRAELGTEPHLRIIKGGGCSSYVGMYIRDGQELSLGQGCVHPGTAAHEFGHALGLWHEFCRPDRDNHVNIIWENIMPNTEHNFFIKSLEDDIDPQNTGYDVSSLMHYDSLAFSNDPQNKKRVIVPQDVHQLTIIGQRARLQFNDIKRINFAYNCVAQCRPEQLKKPCLNGGYQDPKNCRVCRCPSGTAGDDCGAVPVAAGPGMTGCGGRLFVEPCSIKTIGIPPYPSSYGEESHCTWRIKTSAKGLAFAFQSLPDMPCSHAETCHDYVEIRSNVNSLATPGKFFCACGENRGRVVTIDNQGEAMVRFASTTKYEGGGAGSHKGFLLNVYATCNNTLASQIPNSCVITSTGFESCSSVQLPLCPATQTEFIQPF